MPPPTLADARHALGRARRGATRLARATAERVRPLRSPPAVGGNGELWADQARPVPEGWTEAGIREVMASFRIDDGQPGDLLPYVTDALWRFLHTWGLVRGERGRALELGGNPYFITWLLEEFTELDVSVANYFSGPTGAARQTLRYRQQGRDHEVDIEYQQFNLEEDRFPYDEGSFGVVLFCEIIEHLLMDPLHALREIHRVLEPGGLLVLTTPNVARLGNVLTITAGGNIYDPYSGFGPYGRHNREYTRHELHQLLGFAGFGELHSFTADAHPADLRRQPGYDQVAPALVHRRADLGQYLFVAGRATSTPSPGLPTAFYRSWPASELVEL